MSVALIIAFTTTLALGTTPAPGAREPLADLLERFPEVAGSDDEPGMDKEEQAMATALQAYGATAIPPLLAMLTSEKEAVRELAAYTLSEIDGLTDEHLDALVEGWQLGTSWIERAVGRVGTPRALEVLVETLHEYPSSQSQLSGALVMAGGKGALALVESLRDASPRKPAFVDSACQILREMEQDAGTTAIEPLLAVAEAPKLHIKNRGHAVRLVGCLGFRAQPVAPRLEQLRAKTPRLSNDVGAALTNIVPELKAALFAQHLRTAPGIPLLRELAALRENGRGAGAVLVELQSHANWEIRVAAVRAMGYLRDTEATELLISLLEDTKDWQRVFVSIEALGRFKDARAIDPLERVAKTHWYPYVRQAALHAIKVIRGEAMYTEQTHFPSEFLAYRYSEYEPGDAVDPPFVPGSDELSAEALKPLSYTVKMPAREDRRASIQKLGAGCGLRVANGHLLGSDRGEWGGELVHQTAKGTTTMLLKENVRSIHRIGDTLVAVTGLAHLSSHRGMLYRIVSKADTYVTEPWRTLPSAPKVAGMMEDGRLFVSCEGGDIIVTADGTLEMSTRESRRARPAK